MNMSIEDNMPTPMHHLLDCKNCGDERGYPHQLMHHDSGKNDNGKCNIRMNGVECQCSGFEEKEADDISYHDER